MGSWSIIGEAKDITTVEEIMAVEEAGNNVVCCQGSPMLGAEVILEGFTEENQATYTPEEEAKMLEEALEAAKKADQVVLFIGEDRLQSGEATSNATIQIPQIQQNLLERVAEINENIAVVLFSGRPLDLRDVQIKAKAILEVWMPGTEGAGAITDVLYGRYNPTGKLPMSFPYCVGQVPVHYNEYATGRPQCGRQRQGSFPFQISGHPERTAVSVRLRAELYDLYCFGSFSGQRQHERRRKHPGSGNRKKYRHLCRNRNHPAVSP